MGRGVENGIAMGLRLLLVGVGKIALEDFSIYNPHV